MTADDVERVAREIWNSRYAKDGGVWAYVETKDVWYAMARAALSALPERELLREALEALTEMLRHSGVADAHAMDKFESDHDAERRARAAADKIRDALEHDKGEKL